MKYVGFAWCVMALVLTTTVLIVSLVADSSFLQIALMFLWSVANLACVCVFAEELWGRSGWNGFFPEDRRDRKWQDR